MEIKGLPSATMNMAAMLRNSFFICGTIASRGKLGQNNPWKENTDESMKIVVHFHARNESEHRLFE